MSTPAVTPASNNTAAPPTANWEGSFVEEDLRQSAMGAGVGVVSSPTASSKSAPPQAEGVDVGDHGGLGGIEEEPEQKKCCNALRFKGVPEAQGYALLTFARGGIIMSNIFLSTALITLASDAAGCTKDEGEGDEATGEGEDTAAAAEDGVNTCDETIYGFKPSSLITNIALVSGLISAFLLPVIGAIVDYTPHRRFVGVFSATFITIVQGVQIWLNETTWFPMAILQAVNGFMYMVQVMAVYAYLPDLGRFVGPKKMAWFSALFTMCQFGAQSAYLVLNVALSLGLGWVGQDVKIAQLSQAICVVWLLVTFVPGWRKLPKVPALRPRPEGKWLVSIGFSQVWHTVIGINKHYGSGLRWYFLAVAFAEAGANAFTVVSVTFMVEVLGMNGTEVAIIFLITLLASIPGSKLGQFIAKRTNPITSWKINLIVFSVITIAGAFVLTSPEVKYVCFAFGVLWGIMLGWFYPLENLVFTLSVPKGQESELSGFYTYCRSIITWLPPLIFTVMNESGLHMKWGLISLVIFLVVGLVFLQIMAPWEDVLEAAKTNKMTRVFGEDEEEGESIGSKNTKEGEEFSA